MEIKTQAEINELNNKVPWNKKWVEVLELKNIKNLKPILNQQWGDKESFRNFKKGYEKGFEALKQHILNQLK